jgi:prephenate dehydrogenase
VADAELVVVGVPVQLVAETVAEVRRHCPPNCIITDLGSTKRQIVAAAANQQGYGHFVGCHPLAGDHRSGCQFARADLFADRLVVLTPTPHTDQRAADRLEHFWRVVGSRVQCMSPDQHDHLLALASHVPHLASTAVAATTPREALDFVASGWLDTTRVAAGHVEMWRQIVDTNRQPILAGLDLLVANLQAIRDAVATGDDARLADLLAQGKQIRDAVGN